MEKINVVLDTDICNEIDDQFALAYLLQSLDNINLEAITIAPFFKSNETYGKYNSIEEGEDISYKTICKILEILKMENLKSKVIKGATKYFYQSKETNLASNKIIEVARKNNHTTIIAIGAITNVAVAIYNAPDISNKIDIVWLGGHSFLSEDNKEFNFKQDLEATQFVFESKVPLTVIPCKNVAECLITTSYELKNYLNKSEIGKYLYKEFMKYLEIVKHMEDCVGRSKVLWDIAAVAYLINKDWFSVKPVSAPTILNDTTYKQTSGRHNINFVYSIKRDFVFRDLFYKLGYKNEE